MAASAWPSAQSPVAALGLPVRHSLPLSIKLQGRRDPAGGGTAASLALRGKKRVTLAELHWIMSLLRAVYDVLPNPFNLHIWGNSVTVLKVIAVEHADAP